MSDPEDRAALSQLHAMQRHLESIAICAREVTVLIRLVWLLAGLWIIGGCIEVVEKWLR